VPALISASPLRYSHPSAPHPTKKTRCSAIRAWKSFPMTATWWSCRDPNSGPTLDGHASATSAPLSWWTHWSTGVYFRARLEAQHGREG